ncbi:hypothetical protein VTN02DRAFT_308 [Thermoascus thermophilus]
MLINANTAISTSAVLLVPYSTWHVPKYHEWMKDEEIRAATASEPLSLEEEYAMQQSWRHDADKLTFIVCHGLGPATQERCTVRESDDSADKMLGDINLFLRIDDGEAGDSAAPQIVGELELMIAERHHQRKGFGRASLLTFLRYIADHEARILDEFMNGNVTSAASSESVARVPQPWRLGCLSVKIGQENARSLALFEGLGFRKVSQEPNFFGEFELRRTELGREKVDGELARFGIEGYVEVPYRDEN